jgi:hypothetical protein
MSQPVGLWYNQQVYQPIVRGPRSVLNNEPEVRNERFSENRVGSDGLELTISTIDNKHVARKVQALSKVLFALR